MVAHEILTNIWVSDIKTALDKEFITNHNIGVVINCTKDLPFTSLDIKKYRLPVDDNLQDCDKQDMLKYLPEMIDIILLAYKTLTPILVYCQVGIQRSPTVIAAFIIRMTGISYEEAIRFIQSKKDMTFRPTINFNQSLQDFCKKEKSS